MELKGVSYEVSLAGISSDTTPKASITVNGESETLTEGQTKEIIAGVEVFARTVFKTGDNAGYVIIELGSDKLSFESGSEVKTGSDDTKIKGTYVNITGGVGAVTTLKVGISVDDNNEDSLLAGESFEDPVFGTVKVDLADIPNGPLLEDNKGTDSSTTRKAITFSRASDTCVQTTFEDKNSKTATIEFADGTTAGAIALEDDDDNPILVVEGQNATEDDYIILNSGNNQHFMQITDIDTDQTGGSIEFEDQFSGTSFSIDDSTDLDSDGASDTITISGQTYTVYVVDADANIVSVRTSDYNGNTDGSVISVFPYLETINGKEFKVAFTEDVMALNDYTTNGSADSREVTLSLPSGDVVVDNNGGPDNVTITPTGASATTLNTLGATYTVLVDATYYTFTIADGTGANNIDMTVGMGVSGNSTDAMQTDAGLLFVEDEDNSDSDEHNAVIIPTTATTSKADVDIAGIVFTNAEADLNQGFEDTDYEGSIDPFGAYVVEDSSDTD